MIWNEEYVVVKVNLFKTFQMDILLWREIILYAYYITLTKF